MNLPAHAFVFQRRIRDLGFVGRKFVSKTEKTTDLGGGEVPKKLYDLTLHKRRDFFFF